MPKPSAQYQESEVPMSSRVPAAVARKDFAKVMKRSQAGERIKVTRHNRTIAILIPKKDLQHLEDCERARRRSR